MTNKSRASALSASDLASTAAKKTAKVQRKLKAAETELSRTNAVLVNEMAPVEREVLIEAIKDNQAAEEKVHEAAEELEVVTELLIDAQAAEEASKHGKENKEGVGKTGQGAKSLIPHLRNNAASRPAN